MLQCVYNVIFYYAVQNKLSNENIRTIHEVVQHIRYKDNII